MPAVAEDGGQETTARIGLYETIYSPILNVRLVEKGRENRSSGNQQRRHSKGSPTFWHPGNVVGPFRLFYLTDLAFSLSTARTGPVRNAPIVVRKADGYLFIPWSNVVYLNEFGTFYTRTAPEEDDS
jgi:hypothetical protein